MDALPSGIMKRLQETVKLMMEAGFEEECSDVYSKWRREFVEQCHWALGLQFQEPNMEDVEKWIKMCEVAGKILFPIERRLCDYLFSGFPLAADAYLPKVCKQLTIGLLSFVDTAITARSYLPNFLFNIVPKMYESLTAMSKECISLNLFELSILDYFRDVLERLDILNNFANLFHRNNARAHVADGGLHLITKQVMNYILMIWEDKIWRAPQSYRIVSGREKSSLWMLTARTIGFLESELEAKSRDYYADPALGYLFMIKNLSYIGEKAKYLKLNVDRIILDDDWFQQNTAKVEEYFSLYLESSWNKMLDFLKLETNESVAPGVVEKLMKDRLHFFNLHFDETCNVQSTWIVSDKTLRERMIKSIHTILLPEYGRFYDRFLHVFGDRACNYVLFRADEIENHKDKNQIPTKQVPDVDVNLVMDALPSGIMKRLQETVKLMMEAGFEEECSDIYCKWRREFVEQCHWALGLQFQEPNMEDVEKWIKTCEVAGKILFPIERRLCDYLFSGFPLAADASSMKVCKELTICLLSFADTAIAAWLPNLLLEVVPKMYASLRTLKWDLMSLNLLGNSVLLLDCFEDVTERLVILKNVTNFFHRNNEQAHVAYGGLHLVTKQLMNYICQGMIKSASGASGIVPHREVKSSYWVLPARMIELFESALEAKSRDYYTDPAMGYVFMMDNLSYIGEKAKYVKPYKDGIIFDDGWFQQNTAKVEEYFNLYLKSSWKKILDFLKLETNESVAPGVVEKLETKDKLRLFNLHFEETCNLQSTWIVSDKRLREWMIKSVHSILLPEYGRFYDRFLRDFGECASNYILFGIEEIQNCLSNLFLLDE
ncbi:unnamed protein product [Sphenostylis stenocarpa]|uniref:Exocyst subunit Exo70 family protein n=1 Tax=Sphenostylis stenocarpa TaxID=92480 RepID=A0AA86TBP2_9FABA|nr:unnamed protein product [Sphenostylis stenocarpa]